MKITKQIHQKLHEHIEIENERVYNGYKNSLGRELNNDVKSKISHDEII